MKLKRLLSLASLLLCGALLLPVSASAWTLESYLFFPSKISYQYDDAERYTAGGATLTGTIRKVDIDWISGGVQVLTTKGSDVSFFEQSDRELPEELVLRYWLDGDTLRIRYCRSGEWKLAEQPERYNKQLTLLLPEGLTLEKLEIDAASAGVALDGIPCKELAIDAVSGGVALDGVTCETLKTDSVSGAVQATGCTVTRKAAFESVSGSIDAQLAGAMRELKAKTVSGSIQMAAGAPQQVETESVSGSTTLSVQAMPDESEISTTSGSVTLCVPQDAGFRLDYSAASGRFRSELAHQSASTRKRGGTYVFGTGTARCTVDTVSGDLTVKAL